MHTITIDGFNLTAQQVISVARAPHLKSPWPIPRALPEAKPRLHRKHLDAR
jgi:hypothetical protein